MIGRLHEQDAKEDESVAKNGQEAFTSDDGCFLSKDAAFDDAMDTYTPLWLD